MALPATDAFTDTDDTALTAHGTSWTANAGALRIFENRLEGNSASANCAAHWNADVFANDQYAFITITELNGPLLGVCLRAHASAETYYRLMANENDVEIAKFITGTETLLGAGFAGVGSGDKIKLEIVGTTLEYFKDTGGGWVTQGTRSDSAISSGSAGVAGTDADNSFPTTADDWEGGNLGSPAAAGITCALLHRKQMKHMLNR